MAIRRSTSAIAHLKGSTIRAVDPAGFPPFVSEISKFGFDSYDQPPAYISLSGDDPVSGDIEYYINSPRTLQGSDDIIFPGSYFDRGW
jgi:hypothetical protein